MATFKTVNGCGKYRDLNSKEDVIHYILNPNKTPHGLIGSYMVDTFAPAKSMYEVSAQFNKESGVQLRHLIVSFSRYDNCDIYTADEIASEFMLFIGQKYQVIYAVHENKYNVHFHLVFNSVSYVDGQRYYGTRSEHQQMLNVLNAIVRKHGIKEVYYVKLNP